MHAFSRDNYTYDDQKISKSLAKKMRNYAKKLFNEGTSELVIEDKVYEKFKDELPD